MAEDYASRGFGIGTGSRTLHEVVAPHAPEPHLDDAVGRREVIMNVHRRAWGGAGRAGRVRVRHRFDGSLNRTVGDILDALRGDGP